MPFGINLRLGVHPDVAPHMYEMPSNPFPQRLSARDTTNYRQPVPLWCEGYQTFWFGNQLPGPAVMTPPHAAWINVSSQHDLQPQMRGGSFGQVLTQLESAQLVANWRQAWANLKGRYGS